MMLEASCREVKPDIPRQNKQVKNPFISYQVEQKVDLFVGLWILNPTKSRYEHGLSPQSGFSQIEVSEEDFKITMDWVDAEGKELYLVFDGVPDGKDYAYNSPEIDTIAMLRISDRILDTMSKKNGRVVIYTSRVVSPDGKTMKLMEFGTDENGRQYSNISFYEKN
jgi:hypothetical protein